MKIEIIDAEKADPTMLAACLERIRRFYGDGGKDVNPVITVNEPGRDGFLEYMIKLPYSEPGRALFLGCIRRPNSTEIEFHS